MKMRPLKKNPYPGLYIALEGIDGCGKTTQIENLEKYFIKGGKSVVITSEPRKKGSIIGKLISEALESKVKIPMPAFQYLYSADRVLNHEQIVIPALKRGMTVISHRCFWSAVAYGIFDKGQRRCSQKNADTIMVANGIFSWYYQFLAPDITFYLKVKADTGIKRMTKMKKKLDIYEKKEKLAKVIDGYDWLAKQFPKEIKVINGERPIEQITKEIINYETSHFV